MKEINLLEYCLSRFDLTKDYKNYVCDEFIGSLFLVYKLFKNSNDNIFLITPSNNESTKIIIR